MIEPISFFVPGIPAPGGSKRFVGFAKSTGRAILIDAAGQRNKNWRSICGDMGSQAMSGKPVLEGPLSAIFIFRMPRPKGHYGTRAGVSTLKQSAPSRPLTKPDVTKLVRSTEDALTSIVWRDDAQIVSQEARKYFAEDGKCGCQITIRKL